LTGAKINFQHAPEASLKVILLDHIVSKSSISLKFYWFTSYISVWLCIQKKFIFRLFILVIYITSVIYLVTNLEVFVFRSGLKKHY